MNIPNVLALPLDEAIRRLTAENLSYEVKALVPPRECEADYDGDFRKYVVRQQMLSDDKIVLTIVYR